MQTHSNDFLNMQYAAYCMLHTLVNHKMRHIIKWGASYRSLSTPYYPMQNSDEMTIGKTHSTLAIFDRGTNMADYDHWSLKIWCLIKFDMFCKRNFWLHGYPRLKCRFSGYLNFLTCQMKCYFSCFRILRFKKDLFCPFLIKKRICSSPIERTHFS